MALQIDAKTEEKIKQAYVIWFTTVREDGMPQPTPVWFIWQNGEFLIYSEPNAQKLRNIRQNPRVSLNPNTDEEGEAYVVIMGEATIDEKYPPSNQVAAYLDKYREGIKGLGYAPEKFSQKWSVAIHVRPTHVRGDL